MLGYLKRFFRRTFSSLKVRNYRLYFIGQSVSLPGTWMQTIGQAWLVLKLTDSGTALGIVTALQFLPILLFGAMGGLLADRFPKRKIIYFTQSGSAILALTLALLVATGTIRLWMIYILASSLGCINAIDNPTRRTFVIELVGREKLGNAISLFSTEFNLSRVIGPAIAGFVIAAFGLSPCFFINAASFVPLIVCLFLMKSGEMRTTEPVKPSKGQLKEGFRYVRNTPLLRNLLVMVAIMGTLTYEFQINLPLIAKYTFKGGADSYALLNSAMGIGAVLGGLATASRKKTTARYIIRTAFAFGTAIILVALSPSFHIALFAMIIVGAFSIIFTSLGDTLMQLESDPNMRSRVGALWSVAFLGSTPIGGPTIGWIGEYAGPRWSLTVSGLAAIIAGLLGLFTIWNYTTKKIEKAPAELSPVVEQNKVS
jgi:MFS family permease